MERVYAERCEAVGAKLRMVDFSAVKEHSRDLDGQVFSFGERKELRLSLLGQHQVKNAAVALTALDALRERGWEIPEAAIREGVRKVHLVDGRMDHSLLLEIFTRQGVGTEITQ